MAELDLSLAVAVVALAVPDVSHSLEVPAVVLCLRWDLGAEGRVSS